MSCLPPDGIGRKRFVVVSDVVGPWQAPNSRLLREGLISSRSLFHKEKIVVQKKIIWREE